jgi:hypothetical protein
MEQLAAMNDSDFERGKTEFKQWCIDAAEEIVRITEGEQSNMATNMTKSVETLRQRAIASGDDRNGY